MRGEPKDQVGGTAGPSEAVSLSGHGCGVSGQMVTVNVPRAVVAEAPWGSEQTVVPVGVCPRTYAPTPGADPCPPWGHAVGCGRDLVKEKTAVDSVYQGRVTALQSPEQGPASRAARRACWRWQLTSWSWRWKSAGSQKVLGRDPIGSGSSLQGARRRGCFPDEWKLPGPSV